MDERTTWEGRFSDPDLEARFQRDDQDRARTRLRRGAIAIAVIWATTTVLSALDIPQPMASRASSGNAPPAPSATALPSSVVLLAT